MSSNSDGESLVYAYERLTKQKSKRKILLVISDGQPSCVGVDSMGHTRMVAKQIEKDGLVELRAIGLVDDTVESIYSRSAVIYKCDELEGAVLNVIKDHIIN
jgi:cobalamin biosynthesis protein CobT